MRIRLILVLAATVLAPLVLLGLVAALIFLSAVGIWVHALRPVVRVLDLLVLASVLVDFVRTPAPRRLSIRRHVPARVGLSVEFQRELEVWKREPRAFARRRSAPSTGSESAEAKSGLGAD